MTTQKPREFSIVSTDIYTHLIASVCKTFGAFHYQDYVVLTREKQPGLFVRKQILTGLKDKLKFTNDDVKALTKGDVHKCWGDD